MSDPSLAWTSLQASDARTQIAEDNSSASRSSRCSAAICGTWFALAAAAVVRPSAWLCCFANGPSIAVKSSPQLPRPAAAGPRLRGHRHVDWQGPSGDSTVKAMFGAGCALGVVVASALRRWQSHPSSASSRFAKFSRAKAALTAQAEDGEPLPAAGAPEPAMRGARVTELERSGQLQAGQPVEGVVKQVTQFGAFLDIGIPGKKALIEVSEWSEEGGFPKDYWEEAKLVKGQKVSARVLRVRRLDVFLTRRKGPLKRKYLLRADRDRQDAEAISSFAEVPPGQWIKGQVVSMTPWGVYVSMLTRRLGDKTRVEGLLHHSKFAEGFGEKVELGQEVRVRVLNVDVVKPAILLTMLEAGAAGNKLPDAETEDPN